jgi:hypothetical protein
MIIQTTNLTEFELIFRMKQPSVTAHVYVCMCTLTISKLSIVTNAELVE